MAVVDDEQGTRNTVGIDPSALFLVGASSELVENKRRARTSMTRYRRRMLWATALLVVILVGLALYAYFVGTRTLLEHAEAFSFRRMTVAQLDEQSTFRFFYITNRRPGVANEAIEERYESEREDSLKFGDFDTKIEATLGLGMIIDPSDWFLNEEIRLLDVRGLQQEDFLAQLRQQVQASPRQSLLVVVHGFRERFPSALRKTAFLAHVLDINTPVLVFDWPGDQGSSLRGYRQARQVAKESGAELASTLKLIVENVQPERLWLMANSMGGQVVADAFSLLYQEADFSDSQTEIENVMLTAPDVDHEEFNNRFKEEIKALARNVTVYVSSNDRALLVSRFINRGLRLGESTLDPSNPDQLEQAASLSELLEAGDDRLVVVDVTPVNRTRNFHNFSLETPEFFDDLFLRFTGTSLPQSRELYLLQTLNGADYFVLTQGR
jgi:esterase/lipase superfamily enzyme